MQVPVFLSRPLSSTVGRLAIAATLLLSVAVLLRSQFNLDNDTSLSGIFPWAKSNKQSNPLSNAIPAHHPGDHPIDSLIREADYALQGLVIKQTDNLRDAAQAYRDRRGRQPPPNFDKWFAFAQQRDAVFIEDLFDQIYHDLRPFWGVPAKQIREQAHGYRPSFRVRNGAVTTMWKDQNHQWLVLWQDLLQSIASELPDLDMPVNQMDESRMVVPWEEINEYVRREQKGRRLLPTSALKTTFPSLAGLDSNRQRFKPAFSHKTPNWPQTVVGCPPDSEARKAFSEYNEDFSTPPPLTGRFPPGSYHGYVRNWTIAKSPCDHPKMSGLHGSLIHGVSTSITKQFFPMFAGCKLPVNNEILIPPAMYWTNATFYSGGKDHGGAWEDKQNMVIWKGTSTGGRHNKNTWTRYQRHRFVAMLNGTAIELKEDNPAEASPNFVLPQDGAYNLTAQSTSSRVGLAAWVRSWSDVAFTFLMCNPRTHTHGNWCPYVSRWFEAVKPRIPMNEFYSYKYLPDFDGNSFSGRYRGYLGSTSMPIKGTMFDEWHDSRLVPWKHFVPMDNTYIDIYGIIEYFIGNTADNVEGHDSVGRDIAMTGKLWADKVLRREDMQIYVYRLLLEYARLCSDDRDVLGAII